MYEQYAKRRSSFLSDLGDTFLPLKSASNDIAHIKMYDIERLPADYHSRKLQLRATARIHILKSSPPISPENHFDFQRLFIGCPSIDNRTTVGHILG